MKDPLFNVHDIILLFTAMSSLLLVAFQLLLQTERRTQRRLLTLFFCAQAANAIITLAYWGDYLQALIPIQRDMLGLIQNLCYISQGPLLLLYTRSLLQENFQLQKAARPHWLFIGLYTFIATGAFGASAAGWLDRDSTTIANDFYLLQRLVTFSYGVLSVRLVVLYTRALKNRISDYLTGNPRYLMALLVGFTFCWFWMLSTHLMTYLGSIAISDPLGIAGNYLTFFLIQALFVLNMRQTHTLLSTELENPNAGGDHTDIKPETIARIQQGIDDKKLYLEPAINLETFAAQIEVSPRETSTVINRHYATNFFEFINRYRVEAAKEKLADPAHAHHSITDILLDCGFNSKSAFNRFFKRVVGVTPSEYRAREQRNAKQARAK